MTAAAPAFPEARPIPEPSSLAMLALGAAAFCVALAHSLVEVLLGESPAYVAAETTETGRAE